MIVAASIVTSFQKFLWDLNDYIIAISIQDTRYNKIQNFTIPSLNKV